MTNIKQNSGISEEEKEEMIDRLTEELPVLRARLGISQDDLGNLIGLSRQTYSTLETKKRKMTWSVFLSLIFIFDQNVKTHEFIREQRLFPSKLFEDEALERNGYQKSNMEILTTQLVGLDMINCLDEQAIHAIQTMIMVEYARCNHLPGQSVLKAFDGEKFNLGGESL